ncbi:MAG: hypothetical protein ACT4NL_16680 [Pseudomarimonas sp.]
MIRNICLLALLAVAPMSEAQLLQGSAVPAPTALEVELAATNDVEALRARVVAARTAKDLVAEAAIWKRLSELRPHVGQIKVELAAAYAMQDLKSQAYTALLELQTQGYGMQLGEDPRFARVATTRAWDYIVSSLQTNLSPFGEVERIHSLPKQDLLLESLSWDSSRKQLLVGSIREGTVFRVDAGGKLLPLAKADAKNGMWAVMDLAVDAKRNVLWIASTAVPHFKGYKPERDLGRAGVFKFDLKTGAFLKSYLSPSVLGSAFFMSTLALAPDGTVFAADGVNNAVYMVRDDQLRRVFHATTLSSIRGMTVNGSGSVLYFADSERGIFGYDLKAGKPFDVLVPKTLALAGIEGLVWWQDSLLAVQNGMQPARVMRLILTPDGRTFAGAKPLAAGHPEFSMPTLATLDGDRLLFIANGQKHQYDRFGLARKSDAIEATQIFAVAADYASDMAGSVPTGQPKPSATAPLPGHQPPKMLERQPETKPTEE